MHRLPSVALAIFLASCSPVAAPTPVVELPPVAPASGLPSASVAPSASAAPRVSPALPGAWRAEIPRPPAVRCGGAVRPPPRVTLDGPAASTPQAALPTGAAAGACQAIEKGRAARLAAVRKEIPGMDAADQAQWRGGLLRCAGAGRGAWALEVVGVKEVRWTLVYVGADGRAQRTAPIALGEYEDVAIRATFDFDGDGVAEAIVARSRYEGALTGDIIPTFEIHRARAGVVERYPPAQGLVITEVRDVDGDGRPDLLLPSRYHFPLHHAEMGEGTGFLEVAHALPGGSFSRVDDVAREGARLGCERIDAAAILSAPGEGGVPHVEGYALGQWLSCSRLWGASAGALEAEIRRRFPAGLSGPGEPVLEEVCAAVRVEPPFTLAMPCVP